MVVYAIMETATGLCLPAKDDKGKVMRRGFSFTEPSAGMPRLFNTEQHAKQALTAWRQGKWIRWSGQDSWTGEHEDDVKIKPVAGRKEKEMHIQKFELVKA